MNYKLLLTSQGIVPEIKKYFLSILSKKPEENNVAFITTAAYGATENPHWLQNDRQSLYACGIKKIEELDLKGKNQADLARILANKDIVFIAGGNSFYLLHWIRKSGFHKSIIDFLERGGLYVGVSAGSYVACPTIEQATWKHKDRNKVGITDLAALKLVPFLITAHFEEKYKRIVESAAKRTRYPIVALNDKQAVLVEGSRVKIIGEGRKEFWNGFKET
jgi:dipeptidase E